MRRVSTTPQITQILASLLLSIIVAAQASAADDSVAGIVIVAAGNFFALDAKQERRILERRSKVYPGETLVTGNTAQAQVRFIDGAVISLRPDTELRINQYQYDAKHKKAPNESSVLTLLKGGFRTITGAIGKEKYKVQSSLATIGVRGTHYEAVIASDGLYVGVWHGGVTVSNEKGKVDLGMGADFNFAYTPAINVAPVGLLQAPAVIINQQPAITAPAKADQTSKGTPPAQDKLAGTLPQMNDSLLQDGAANLGGILKLEQTGIAMFAAPSTQNTFDGIRGKATLGNGGSPVFTDNGLSSSDPAYTDTSAKYVLMQGNATVTASGHAAIDSIHTADWGAWGSGAILQTYDAAAGTMQQQTVDKPVYWASATPTQLMPTSGTAVYSNVIGAVGGGTITDGTQVGMSGFSMSANVNFGTGSISGSMNFTTNSSNTWSVNFAGSGAGNVGVNGSNLNLAITGGSVNSGDPLAGTMTGVFTGTNANAIAGGFDVHSTAGPALSAQGAFVVSQ